MKQLQLIAIETDKIPLEKAVGETLLILMAQAILSILNQRKAEPEGKKHDNP